MPIENVQPAPKPIIDANGLTLPLFDEFHLWLQSVFREVYGQDIHIAPDSQDGQVIGIVSKAFHDAYTEIGSAYNAYPPGSAQGVGLSRMVKINGLRRKTPTRSSVDLRIVGWAGTQIRNGSAVDVIGQRWNLPALVTIPPESEIIVTATADQLGDYFAPANTVTQISTPTRGWQTVENPEASTTGLPVETDEMLRIRQSISTALPAKSAFESLVGAVAAIEGTNRYRGYQNETTGVDERGLPQNSIAMVVEGGDASEIAQTIYLKKTPGVPTYGSDHGTVIDEDGIPHKVYFSRPRQAPVAISIPILPKARYTASKDLAIRTAVSNWVNARPIGEGIFVEEIPTPARLITETYPDGDPTFKIKPQVKVSRIVDEPIEEDLEIDYDERVTCTVGDVILEVVG